ncbi:hypothetical protein ACGF0J_11170 [Nonomuraea sp. NPDC047897]|uniref:hypothetical protein n=1 Tax=Nonomuraea sp. NPDC047897 TaxID=3364346 RepID=UPI003721C9B1
MASRESPLHEAARLCLPGIHPEESTVSDAQVLECLGDEDWETDFVLLEELGDARPQPPEFWGLLARAARLVWLREDADWYEWRHSQAVRS